MRTRFAIAAMLYPMIQAVLFGIGLVALLAAPIPPSEMLTAIWWMIWVMAPRLRLQNR